MAWSAGQREGVRIPDLLIAFGVDRAGIIEQWGYAIDREGTPPDFVIEVASASTSVTDYTENTATTSATEYRILAIRSVGGGRYHDTALAGSRLIDGSYHPHRGGMDGRDLCRGYSEALGLYVCWEDGQLLWYDPQSGEYLRTLDEETIARRAEAAAREAETMRADREVAWRLQAEAEVSRLKLEELGDVGE